MTDNVTLDPLIPRSLDPCERSERPVIFGAEMVRAILDGRKTQTRRVVTWTPAASDLPKSHLHDFERAWKDGCTGAGCSAHGGPYEYLHVPFAHPDDGWAKDPKNDTRQRVYCPYGHPGDRLWVREAFFDLEGDVWRALTKSRHVMVHGSINGVAYKAEPLDADVERIWLESGYKWKSPIFMPRAASRITLEIKRIRVERVQEISDADAFAEGFDLAMCESVLNRSAGKSEPLDACWLIDSEGEEWADGGFYCTKCAEKLAAEHDLQIDGNWGSAHESDGPAFCDECGAPLLMSLSEYGIDSELFLECPSVDDRQCYAASGGGAAIAGMIAGGIGDLKDKHKGRLAQIGLATLWDSLNAKRGYPWSANPWVWVVEFSLPADHLEAIRMQQHIVRCFAVSRERKPVRHVEVTPAQLEAARSKYDSARLRRQAARVPVVGESLGVGD